MQAYLNYDLNVLHNIFSMSQFSIHAQSHTQKKKQWQLNVSTFSDFIPVKYFFGLKALLLTLFYYIKYTEKSTSLKKENRIMKMCQS